MTGHLFIIVLVTLSTQQWNTLALSLLPKVTFPYYTYDNACTRITPSASATQTLGQYYVYYSTIDSLFVCSRYNSTRKEDHFLRVIFNWKTSISYRYKSYENPTKPGEMQDYDNSFQPTFKFPITTKPNTTTVIVAYKKDVGFGLIECPARNGSNITGAHVIGTGGKLDKCVDKSNKSY
ncbi:hypothetical protein CHUAL_000178 [Chamberlinius hualienensis]